MSLLCPAPQKPKKTKPGSQLTRSAEAAAFLDRFSFQKPLPLFVKMASARPATSGMSMLLFVVLTLSSVCGGVELGQPGQVQPARALESAAADPYHVKAEAFGLDSRLEDMMNASDVLGALDHNLGAHEAAVRKEFEDSSMRKYRATVDENRGKVQVAGAVVSRAKAKWEHKVALLLKLRAANVKERAKLAAEATTVSARRVKQVAQAKRTGVYMGTQRRELDKVKALLKSLVG